MVIKDRIIVCKSDDMLNTNRSSSERLLDFDPEI